MKDRHHRPFISPKNFQLRHCHPSPHSSLYGPASQRGSQPRACGALQCWQCRYRVVYRAPLRPRTQQIFITGLGPQIDAKTGLGHHLCANCDRWKGHRMHAPHRLASGRSHPPLRQPATTQQHRATCSLGDRSAPRHSGVCCLLTGNRSPGHSRPTPIGSDPERPRYRCRPG